MREVTINITKLSDTYKESPEAFDMLVEDIQHQLSNNDTVVMILEVYKEKGKDMKRKIVQFIRVEDFNKWVDIQYPIL